MAEGKTIAIIQARMGSKRFPGKTMSDLAGKPSIEHLLDAVSQVFARNNIYIASSIDPANDVIETFVNKFGVNIYRGNENNVAERFLDIIVRESPDVFVRFNADSPLLDYRIILKALEKMKATEADIVTTTINNPFPSGMNVELVKGDVFVTAYPDFKEDRHFEHVTRYFYENSGRFRIESLPCPVESPRSYKFTFDTAEDKNNLETFFSSLQLPHYIYTLEQKCRIYTNLFGSGK